MVAVTSGNPHPGALVVLRLRRPSSLINPRRRAHANVRRRLDHRQEVGLLKPALYRAQTDPGSIDSMLLRTSSPEHVRSDLALFERCCHDPDFSVVGVKSDNGESILAGMSP
jgi:hypothetical protein